MLFYSVQPPPFVVAEFIRPNKFGHYERGAVAGGSMDAGTATGY
jgi:hypothetical protein